MSFTRIYDFPFLFDPIKGRMRAITERLYDWTVDFLDANGYEDYIVSLDPDLQIHKVKHIPCFTIKVSEGRIEHEPYTRLFGGSTKGTWVYYPFSVFIYHWKNEKDDPTISHNYDLHILNDLYVKHLRTKRRNQSEMTSYGINDVLEVTSRESDPIGVPALVRMILTGQVKVVREDSP